MDEVAQYNITRWNALVEANALFTRPHLDLTEERARLLIDAQGRLGEVAGKNVLCLAGGGGQQSVAFALLGAHVTVFDLAEGQLRRDREAAEHYRLTIETVQGDMRDLSVLHNQLANAAPSAEVGFDIVCQPYSLNFVPEASLVFRQVASVLRPGGIYTFSCANPFFVGLSPTDWNGDGYVLRHPYQIGREVSYPDQVWVHDSSAPIAPPREFCHTLSAIVNGLVDAGFVIQHLDDQKDFYPDIQAEVGTWDHFTAIAPPWLHFWTIYTRGRK